MKLSLLGMKAARHAHPEPPKPPVPPVPPMPTWPPRRPPVDWYDGFNHILPPPRPFPPPPPPKPCPNCRPKDLDRYGFVPVVGGKYYTGSGKACCPTKVTITKILANEIKFKDAAGVEHSKTYHEFMTSSWRDKSL